MDPNEAPANTEMPGNKWLTATTIPRRQPTRRRDETKMLALAADRLEELLTQLAEAQLRDEVYDFGTVNLIRDLRLLAGQL